MPTVTGRTRSSLLPNVPTAIESGLAGYDVTAWFGIFAPAGLPKPILDKLNADIDAVVKAPDMQKKLQELGADYAGQAYVTAPPATPTAGDTLTLPVVEFTTKGSSASPGRPSHRMAYSRRERA